MSLPPSSLGAVQFTSADVESASAVALVGAPGAAAPVGIDRRGCRGLGTRSARVGRAHGERVRRAGREARDGLARRGRRAGDRRGGLRGRADVGRDLVRRRRSARRRRRPRDVRRGRAGGRAHARGRARRRRRLEQHVDPVVPRVVAAGGEGARAAVGEQAVGARPVGETVERRVVDRGGKPPAVTE